MGQRKSFLKRRETAAPVSAKKERFLSMSIKEKRQLYKCRDNYITLDSVPAWNELMKSDKLQKLRKGYKNSKYRANNSFNDKVSIWRGDITKLEIDGIVNAANNSLLGGGGVDGAIHAAAGSGLREECALLSGCDTGESKITCAYKLPAKYVIHTVGPIGGNETKLRGCYQNSLRLLKEYNLRSVAFPCISTGIYGYPNLPAAKVALETAREWLEKDKNSELVDRIIFCLFLPKDVDIYEELMYQFFPPGADGEDSDATNDKPKSNQDDKPEDQETEPKAEVKPDAEDETCNEGEAKVEDSVKATSDSTRDGKGDNNSEAQETEKSSESEKR